jgi:protein TonB
MFEDLLESSWRRQKTHTRWTVLVSALIQGTLLTILILVPLIYTEALPRTLLNTILVAPPPPPPPAPPPAPPQVVKVKPMTRLMQAGVLRAPTAIPKQVAIIKEEELPPDVTAVGVTGGVPGGVPGGQAGGVLGGIIGGVVGSAAPPPPKEAPKRQRVGGQVQQANLIFSPKPIYPPLARQTRIQGTVRLQAIIAKDGTITQLEILSGPPLLQQSALDAVRQWRYKPTLLNGEPVEVITTIDVVFTLGGGS